ncbi:MAG: YciI family protein [Gemmatimonadaceae bacterium]
MVVGATRAPNQTDREPRDNNAIHCDGHGEEGNEQGAQARGHRRDAEVQRGRREGRRAAARRKGLAPTSKGARITYGSGTPMVIDGPFAESKELVAGFSIIKVDSLQDAITWVKNAPYDFPNGEGEVEIRKLMEIEDFAEGFTPNAEVARVKFK